MSKGSDGVRGCLMVSGGVILCQGVSYCVRGHQMVSGGVI